MLVPFFESDCKKVTDAYFNRPIKQDSIVNLDDIFIEQTIKNMDVWHMLGACSAANIDSLKIRCRYHIDEQQIKELKNIIIQLF